MSATIYAVMAEARTCALSMLESATFIQNELPNVQMSDELREQTRQVCDSLIGTKHDIFTELAELDELVSAKASLSVIHLRVNRIVKWFREDTAQMHELVMGSTPPVNKTRHASRPMSWSSNRPLTSSTPSTAPKLLPMVIALRPTGKTFTSRLTGDIS
jgi:hypothetical protein